jgi:hypothetical protein
MKWTIFIMLCVATACGAGPAKPPRAVATAVGSPRADFGKYHTFSFATANPPASGYEITSRSLEVQRRLAPIVQASLEKRGYAEDPVAPDLVIKISTGSGALTGEKMQRGNPQEATPTGFIGIDAYDRETGASIWHGSAFAEIDPERIDDGLLARGVEHMLSDFPTRQRQASLESYSP